MCIIYHQGLLVRNRHCEGGIKKKIRLATIALGNFYKTWKAKTDLLKYILEHMRQSCQYYCIDQKAGLCRESINNR